MTSLDLRLRIETWDPAAQLGIEAGKRLAKYTNLERVITSPRPRRDLTVCSRFGDLCLKALKASGTLSAVKARS